MGAKWLNESIHSGLLFFCSTECLNFILERLKALFLSCLAPACLPANLVTGHNQMAMDSCIEFSNEWGNNPREDYNGGRGGVDLGTTQNGHRDPLRRGPILTSINSHDGLEIT